MKNMKVSFSQKTQDGNMSKTVMWVLIALTAVVYALFWLIGYDRLWAENPDFRAPHFTDLLLWFGMAVVLAAVVVALWAVFRYKRRTGRREKTVNGIAVYRLTLGVAGGLVLLMLLSLIVSSGEPLVVNGEAYSNKAWLKVADLFIFTSSALLFVAVASLLCSHVSTLLKSKRK